MSNDLIERLGKLQDSCNKQELGLLDTDYVFELAGRTAEALEAKDKRIALEVAYSEELLQSGAALEARLDNETESHKMTLNRESILKARVAELEAKLYDSENAYKWLKSELLTSAKIIGEQRDNIEQLEATLRAVVFEYRAADDLEGAAKFMAELAEQTLGERDEQ